MMACLDTTMLVDLSHPHRKANQGAAHKIVELVERDELLATTGFNIAELYLGVELARDRESELESVRRILAPLTVFVFDDRAAWLFAEIAAHLRRIGRPAGDMDVLIAATATAAGHCLVTRNSLHFANIPHLAVETY
jgi:tRNA(fMet)-specific endonuclease VapC